MTILLAFLITFAQDCIPNSAFLSTSDLAGRTCEQSPLKIPERQKRRRNRNETSWIAGDGRSNITYRKVSLQTDAGGDGGNERP